MVVDNAGGVWLRGRTVYRFRLDEVASWCQVITGDSEGESSRIELTLSDGQSLLIEGNTVEDFIQGFVDFLPNKQGLTSRCT